MSLRSALERGPRPGLYYPQASDLTGVGSAHSARTTSEWASRRARGSRRVGNELRRARCAPLQGRKWRAACAPVGGGPEFGVWSLEFHGCGSAPCPRRPPCLNRIGRFVFFCAFCAFLRPTPARRLASACALLRPAPRWIAAIETHRRSGSTRTSQRQAWPGETSTSPARLLKELCRPKKGSGQKKPSAVPP